MEEVAKRSGVSKQTVYSHFTNKDALFSAVIAFKCEEYMIKIEDLADHGGSIEQALTNIGERFLALFQDADVVAMFSIIIAEARNTPRAAELFYEAGPLASIKALSEILFNLCNNRLSKENARLLAIDFYSFLKGHWHMRSLMNLDFILTETQREKHVREVVGKTMSLLKHYYNQD